MNKLKSPFVFSRKQKNGILLLLLLIIVTQGFYFLLSSKNDETNVDHKDLAKFIKEVDSLKLVESENRKPKIYPFNPNFITDHKGYSLGMSNEEIDRLLAFRKQDKWVNSVQQFQDVTKVSDSLLDAISPYFKFPDWVTNPKPKSSSWVDYSKSNENKAYLTKTFEQKIDLNKATSEQLQKVNGIGVALADRIIKYRGKFVGGFISDIQLQDVYGLSPEVIERVKNDFTVKTPRPIQKINLNTATKEQLVTIQHIDYEVAHYIIEQRTLREGFKSLDELTKVKAFPIGKIDIIKLYLTLE
ncbi:helix-hairpin-helix domain-containing protein [Subsaxibacter sp. CAU 1640]|uniref:ComEA family DNA-binding protein n=1 Tax=Subsaxibacter sp. CAU 1640 TaxID=2933271 RepID=UPI00200630CA|nr:helix-hairpin-helix domain-containing protein [Subsaxibacter sp. CAU 1640]MCK7590056.1 helix-hairpin-helix domain-containing protein [Subsaxibacter sp. CAU 1640]